MNTEKPIATTPEPPYYAVIFTSIRTGTDEAGYQAMAEAMYELAVQQPGYLGIESAHDPGGGAGITVSYWSSPEAIAAWKANLDHRMAQRTGRERWYVEYTARVCRVERSYSFARRDAVAAAEG